MSKKEKKIKSLKKELKELKSQVRKLKLASAGRKKDKVAKVLGRDTKSAMPSPAIAKIEKAPGVSQDPKTVTTRIVGQR
jgi:hypothetical protein